MVFFGWRPYVPVAQRQRQARKQIAEMKKKGQSVAPVTIDGRVIAKSFWGKSWCDNLERYSDYENRLPRGRTYVRNGSVVDLRIEKGEVAAWVSGSKLYRVKATIVPVKAARWKAICRDCAGTIDSLVELLQGRLAKGVMDRVCRKGDGLFPAPSEIKLSCSCPDWAGMCKHVAAVLYGVGARLDHKPELLFVLRGVDESDLLARANADLPLATIKPTGMKVLGNIDVTAVFGLDMAEAADAAGPAPAPTAPKRVQRRKATEHGTAAAATTSKGATNTGCETPVTSARKSPARTTGMATVGRARKWLPATTDKEKAKLARRALSATTGKTRATFNNPINKAAATSKPTKTAALKASEAGRATRSRSEPKWVALARARKRRTYRQLRPPI